MNQFRALTLAAGAALALTGLAQPARAQIAIRVGAPPVCPYGYYDFAPYACAPYGYYGPEWFANGIFVGAGPWFHGPRAFNGHVDNHFDPRHGYHGPHPERGARPTHSTHGMPQFHGNEMRDGRGHEHGHR
jgi:hypothetical protein